MKLIISEHQRENIIYHFISKLSNNISNLKKRQTKSMSFGRGYKYFDPQSRQVIFHVVSGGPVIWEKGGNTRPAYPGIRLYVDGKTYNEIYSFFGDVDETILKWFNKTYKQDADKLIVGIKK